MFDVYVMSMEGCLRWVRSYCRPNVIPWILELLRLDGLKGDDKMLPPC